MTDRTALRASLIDGLRACRDTEREVFAALDPVARDAPGADGGWSAKDNLAHLSAWRRRQAAKMAAIREGRPEPELPRRRRPRRHQRGLPCGTRRLAMGRGRRGRRRQRGRLDRRGPDGERRRPRGSEDHRLDHGRRPGTRPRSSRTDRGDGRAGRHGPGARRADPVARSIAATGRTARPRTPATTSPASTRSAAGSTRLGRCSTRRFPRRRISAGMRRPTTT